MAENVVKRILKISVFVNDTSCGGDKEQKS